MLGIRQPSDAGLEYCAALITEYTALDCAQVLTLLKRYGGLSRHDRNHIVKLLCQGHAKKVEAGERSYCLFVDDLLGQQQIVVKPLPTYVNSFDIKSCGITGCSIMGDGSISIILDIANLYSAGQGMF